MSHSTPQKKLIPFHRAAYYLPEMASVDLDIALHIEKLVVDISEDIVDTYDKLAHGPDTKWTAYRISYCIFLINMAHFTMDYVVKEEPPYDSIDEVVKIIGDTQVTRQTVEADVQTAKYLSQWISVFGTIIYAWSGFDQHITNRVSVDDFNKMIHYFQQNPEKHAEIRDKLERLRRHDVKMPDTAPGGNISIHYIKLFTSDAYKQLKIIDGTELSPYDDIQEVFPDVPAYKHIHIIVELPEVIHRFSRFRTPSPNLEVSSHCTSVLKRKNREERENRYPAILPGHESPTERATARFRIYENIHRTSYTIIETEGMRFSRISETKLRQRRTPLLKCVLVVNTLRAYEKMSDNEKHAQTSSSAMSEGVYIERRRSTSLDQDPGKLEAVVEQILANAIALQHQETHRRKSMPLKERNITEAIEVINSNVDNSLRRTSVAKEHYQFLVCGGTAGIGKTRYGQEVYRYLEEQWIPPPEWVTDDIPPHLEYILLDFIDGLVLDEFDNQLTPSIILGIRMAYVFYVQRQYMMTFKVFRAGAMNYKDYFLTGLVINGIRDSLELDDQQQFMLFLQIDEFQKIIGFEDRSTDEQLFNHMMNYLGPYMTGQTGTFVQTFLSGTAPYTLVKSKEPTSYSWAFVDCPLLSMSSRIEIMLYFATDCKVPEDRWILISWVHQLLSDTGGLPRALEYLFEHCFGRNHQHTQEFFDSIDDQDPNQIFNDVASDLDRRYSVKAFAEQHRNLALALIYRSIGVIPGTKLDIPSNEYPQITLELLERDKHLVLKDIGGGQVIVQLPFIFVYLYNQALHFATGILKDTFSPKRTIQWQDWEQFVAEFVVLRNNLLIQLGQETATIGEIYSGAFGNDDILNLRVRLRVLDVRRVREQFPSSLKLTNFTSGVPVE
ncbi:hypothetical protein BC937DRAFT_90486 [Endogone sp. FLAS-F59071]|nr:hypothetical protein BC937DRAFT_90486 [Endogone sp. FLAS-F59071]|eukprot:RUS17051.1 hypothetical protein BC937DRAFT_90486 [Endogone sp. FLAS-F59071]